MQDGPEKGKDGDLTDPGRNTSDNLSRTSALEAVTSKVEKEKQYGGAEVIEIIGNALSADGREQKDRADKAETAFNTLKGAHEGLKNQFTTVSDQITQFLKEKEEAELAGIQDNQPLVDVIRGRQANTREAIRVQGIEAEANRVKEAAEAKIVEATQKEVTLSIKLAAMAAQVDEKTLVELVPDGNQERLAKAITILKNQPAPDPNNPGKALPNALQQKPASAISAGGESRSVSEKMLADAKGK